jgi:hypothetical protein
MGRVKHNRRVMSVEEHLNRRLLGAAILVIGPTILTVILVEWFEYLLPRMADPFRQLAYGIARPFVTTLLVASVISIAAGAVTIVSALLVAKKEYERGHL